MTSALDDEDLELLTAQPRRPSKEGRDPNLPIAAAGHHPSAHAATSKPQQRLGQYNVVKTLGEGSFGKVKLAVHQISGQKVALKIISRRKLVTRDMAGRIEREIQYLQLLRHPHIIKLFTVITTQTEIIMVLEYAGGELFDYIVQHGKMAEDKARKFFQQIVCAVEYCHRHKIVHRDLKPENLLLDEQLNVKIADFGLSNIMTDGNFLKTSCGSPNYAAPEVISGKLYAGPEVDVWSCGVILYVLLVGRLPFDDEYIPALFKKIAQGNYVVPSYLSSGAVRLIRKMLQVNPVNRITIQEIRQDPWFVKDLPEYLQPPVEDFMDTGVDPNKAIDPHALAKGRPAAIQEKLHQTVVGKLGKTMGYAPDDVQDALAKDEPSAIKDAYLIVRENQLMKTNPSLAQDQPAFVAQSPPAFDSSKFLTSPRSPQVRPPPSPLNPESPQPTRQISTSSEARSPGSTVAILPSSLPEYHAAFMKGRVDKSTSPLNVDDLQHEPERPRTEEEKRIAVERLRGRGALNNVARHDPIGPMTSLTDKHSKKPRQTKWQFGIRSRNTPCEAMVAIYKALQRMGAQWEVPNPREPGTGSGDESPRRQRQGSQSPEYSDSDPEAGTDPEYATHSEQERRRRRRAEQQARSDRGERRGRQRYGRWNDYGYTLPEDPWVIHARFQKGGLYPPGVTNVSSRHSSRIDLQMHDERRRSSAVSSAAGSLAGSTENMAATGPATAPQSASGSVYSSRELPAPNESVWVYVTIQLYSIEKDFYLVDFKCAGYERLVRRFAKEVDGSNGSDVVQTDVVQGYDDDDDDDDGYTVNEDGEQLVGVGRSAEEKEKTSPFPFVEVCSSLIVQLAQQGD